VDQMRLGRVSDGKMHDRVLLVTEDLQAGDIWVHVLRQRGVDAALVGSAEGALRRWAEEAFELVIVDVYIQQLDGIELCRRLRKGGDDPILLLMPGRDEARLLEAYQAGVDECIVKPVSPLVLVAKVLAWLRNVRTIPAEALPGEWR
jgi:two-component system OmpR family response regulator